jgi:hypothetical protein
MGWVECKIAIMIVTIIVMKNAPLWTLGRGNLQISRQLLVTNRAPKSEGQRRRKLSNCLICNGLRLKPVMLALDAGFKSELLQLEAVQIRFDGAVPNPMLSKCPVLRH